MNYEQISALTLNDSITMLFHRIVDLSLLPEGEAAWEYDSEIGLSEIDHWIFNVVLVKPTLEALEAEFVTYKAELTAIEDARIAEAARVADIQARWDLMQDIRANMNKAGLTDSNPALVLLQIINDNDQTKLELLESKAAGIASDLEFNNLVDKARKKRALGLSAMDLLAAINDSKGLTGEQVGAMLSSLATAKALLESGSISTSIGYISALTPLPANITEDDRTAVVNFLTAGLAAI